MDLKEIIRDVDGFYSLIDFVSEEGNWTKEKRIGILNGIRKVKYAIIGFEEEGGIDVIEERITKSVWRELHDVIPLVNYIIIGKEDTFRALSIKAAENEANSNDLYCSAFESNMDMELIFRLFNTIMDDLTKFSSKNEYLLEVTGSFQSNFEEDILSENLFFHLLMKCKLDFIDNNFDAYLGVLRTRSPWVGSPDHVLLQKVGELYVKGLLSERIIQPIPFLLLGNAHFVLGKETSNTYCVEFLNLLNRKLALIQKDKIVIPENIMDHRINTTILREDIEAHFIRLYKFLKAKGEKVTEKEFELLMGSNFHCFDREVLPRKLNITKYKGIITRFVYDLMGMESVHPNGINDRYAKFLIDNFEQFSDKSIEQIKNNFSAIPNNYPF